MKTPFAQKLPLWPRGLVETGVRFVTVSFGGWDTHDADFPRLKDQLLPPLDSGLSGLFLALEQKGLLESTTVFVTGEFGRTPKINPRGGRDHYPRAMFCLMAGGGISRRPGRLCLRRPQRSARTTRTRPMTWRPQPAVTLGIDITKEYHAQRRRPVMICFAMGKADRGTVAWEEQAEFVVLQLEASGFGARLSSRLSLITVTDNRCTSGGICRRSRLRITPLAFLCHKVEEQARLNDQRSTGTSEVRSPGRGRLHYQNVLRRLSGRLAFL